jgi:hypothetical protein
MTTVLHETFSRTDKGLEEFEYEGATVTGVYIWSVGEDRYVQAANVGDSSAFLWYVGRLCTILLLLANA